MTPEEEIKDPLVLEFLGLKDEYSETVLEEALILHLERFLLELGTDFAFSRHLLEMYRRQLTNPVLRRTITRLANRLSKVSTELRRFSASSK